MAGRKLLVVGGGFGGLDVARSVGRSRAARAYWDTLVVDKENFFQFNPLLPAVAVGSVETRHIVYPLRTMALHRHIRFHKNKVMALDLVRREAVLHNQLVEPFDTLVIACGTVTNYYGVTGAEAHSRPFKTLVDAMWLRARVVELFEMAEQAQTRDQRRTLLTFVVVGGGVTGVEVAAELIEMARETLLPKYPSVQLSDVSVTIIEGGERIVPSALPDHSRYVSRFLEHRGVRVKLGARVVRVEEKRLMLATDGDGRVHDRLDGRRKTARCDPHLADASPRQRTRARGRKPAALALDGSAIEDVWRHRRCAAARAAGRLVFAHVGADRGGHGPVCR
jgi:NADH dehydrogenase